MNGLVQRGLEAHRSGKTAQAEQSYREALEQSPPDSDAFYLLGMLLHETGRSNEGAELICSGLRRHPNVALYHNGLGCILSALGRKDEALRNFLRSVELDPLFTDAQINLSLALVRCAPTQGSEMPSPGLVTFGQPSLESQREAEWALRTKTALQHALTLRPNHPGLLTNLGNIALAEGNLSAAVDFQQRAAGVDSGNTGIHINLAMALMQLGRVSKAISVMQNAIKIAPDQPAPHYHLAHALLLTGRYGEGWREYEWRLRLPDFPHEGTDSEIPPWVGQPLRGRRLLVYCEQGYGDAIQFVRFIPALVARGAQVVLSCPPPLTKLLATVSPDITIIIKGQAIGADYQVHLMSLPLLLGAPIPNKYPYLYTDPHLLASWRQQVTGPGLKIGLVWAGRPSHPNDKNRSLALSRFAALAKRQEVRLFSLQTGERAADLASTAWSAQITDLASGLTDFSETAAAIMALDLVLCVDTAVAHLAGALGRPTWVLLPFAPDWRWLHDGETCPWYPTMRLFRQPKPGDWDEPLEAILNEIDRLRRQVKEISQWFSMKFT